MLFPCLHHLWCDLRKPVTWCKNWYFELLVSSESLNYSLSRTFYLDLLWYWYQKLLMLKGCKNKEKHWNYDVNVLHFTVSPFATCDWFSQITSHFVFNWLFGHRLMWTRWHKECKHRISLFPLCDITIAVWEIYGYRVGCQHVTVNQMCDCQYCFKKVVQFQFFNVIP